METKRTYYLYRHIRTDINLPFYIGIGTIHFSNYEFNTDINKYKRAYDKNKRSKFWKSIVNKTEYTVEILFESTNKTIIENKEREFIKLYGKRYDKTGLLVNLNDGGIGLTGRLHSEETKKKMSESRKGKISGMKGKKHLEESKKLISEKHKNKKLSTEHKEILKNRMLGSNNPSFKFNDQQIKEIRDLYNDKKNNKLNQSKIARIFNTYQGTISSIVKNKKRVINN